jgi:hypothetical protein
MPSRSSSPFMKHKYSLPDGFSPSGMWCSASGLALPNISNRGLQGELFLDSATFENEGTTFLQNTRNQWPTDTVSYARRPEPSTWLWKPQNSHPLPHSQELAAGLCSQPNESTQPLYHQFSTILTTTPTSMKYKFPSALYAHFCMHLSPPQVFHAQPTSSSLIQSPY